MAIMISKHGDYKNGYIFTPSSTDSDLQRIFREEYGYDNIRCVICNKNTAKNFRTSSLRYSIITINNKIADGCFFINGTF